MCVECRQVPCHPSCPNAEEPKGLYECKKCGCQIYKGDRYFEKKACVYAKNV